MERRCSFNTICGSFKSKTTYFGGRGAWWDSLVRRVHVRIGDNTACKHLFIMYLYIFIYLLPVVDEKYNLIDLWVYRCATAPSKSSAVQRDARTWRGDRVSCHGRWRKECLLGHGWQRLWPIIKKYSYFSVTRNKHCKIACRLVHVQLASITQTTIWSGCLRIQDVIHCSRCSKAINNE